MHWYSIDRSNAVHSLDREPSNDRLDPCVGGYHWQRFCVEKPTRLFAQVTHAFARKTYSSLSAVNHFRPREPVAPSYPIHQPPLTISSEYIHPDCADARFDFIRLNLSSKTVPMARTKPARPPQPFSTQLPSYAFRIRAETKRVRSGDAIHLLYQLFNCYKQFLNAMPYRVEDGSGRDKRLCVIRNISIMEHKKKSSQNHTRAAF